LDRSRFMHRWRPLWRNSSWCICWSRWWPILR